MPVQDPAAAATMNEIAAHQYTFRADPSIPSPAEGVTKREEGANGDEKSPNKGKAVNRVGRACNGCRKQKMRCEGADNPPCKRCRHANIPCMFEKPMREQQGDAQSADRIQKLESQVGTIQSTLEELVSALKGPNAVAALTAAAAPVRHASPSSSSQHYQSVPPRLSSADGPAHGSPPGGPAGSVSSTSQASANSMTSPVQYMSERELQAAQTLAMGGQRYQARRQERSESVASSQSNFMPQADGSSQHSPSLPRLGPSRTGNAPEDRLPPLNIHTDSFSRHTGSNSSSSNPLSAAPRPLSEITSPKRPRPHTGPVNFSVDMDGMGPPAWNRPRSAGGAWSSNVTSAYSSDNEGELSTSGLTAPLEVLRSLAEHQEQERERRRAAGGRSRATSSVSGDWTAEMEGGERPSKRRRVGRRAARPHVHPDVVTKGIISEEEAKDYFKTYYEHCSKFLPVFEPELDTYEDLHRRSPFSVDAICMVASAIKDASNGQSETTKRLMEEVKMISSNTLWLPVARREVVQASIVVAGWSTNGWLLGGHAIRMALELGIHKAWPRLLKKIRSGSKLKDIRGSDEHDLVVCSRIWFTLFLFEHQIAFGTGRPFMIKTDESVQDAALIMEHPLSVEDDMRLVSSVELMIIRERVNKRMGVEGPVKPDTQEVARDAERQFYDWFERWDIQLAYKWPSKLFYRHSLLVQRYLSELFHNAVALRGIKSMSDVEQLAPDTWQQKLAIQSMKTAQSALDICCRSIAYRDDLKYAPDYTHVTATFAAAFLIRLARLFPKEADLSAILSDVSSLAQELANASATRYSKTLKKMIRIAQKRRVLPEQVTVNGDNALQDGAGAPIVDEGGEMALEVSTDPSLAGAPLNDWPNGAPNQPQQTSLSPPEDLSLIMGLPMIYPDPEFTEPALGGDHPVVNMYLPYPATLQLPPDQIGLFPPETSFSAFHPQGFGYAAATGNWNIDENGNEIPEIW
ncbi:hypothetical protein DACRYDRAFT_117704 [Dacryopinax primogenitus]|uniref:Zn(2)-C6 fungal-type domain-containing protein n=1 Tax=Dacryopinax primogenitus (strain DJM 731) TaxID=1858805 RepID=M5FV58_DACPD|nr:uncharacterized protein DACRYDRAFT_117704 [Dacryopinax primogenitus]EJU00144.1 hypothetical protein DACRYDRAFT_117704 [Dacryopinax primogenitus]